MCHLRSETLRVSPILSHPPDPDTRSLQLFHHFPPRFSSAATPITCARRRHRTSGEWGGEYGFIFTGFHSRKAECLVSWYAPFYPLHRPESFAERKFNLFLPGSHRAAKFHRDNWQSTVISFSMSSHETNPRKLVYPDMCFIISVAPDHEHATADSSAIPTGI